APLVRYADSSGRVTFATDEQRAARALKGAFALAAKHPSRITRLYVYSWRNRTATRFDSGLVRADGTPRPALAGLRGHLGPAGRGRGADRAPALRARALPRDRGRARRRPPGRLAGLRTGRRRDALRARAPGPEGTGQARAGEGRRGRRDPHCPRDPSVTLTVR